MAYKVEEISSGAGLKKFIKLPWKIYYGDPNWVPPLIVSEKEMLDKEKGPFFANGLAKYFMVSDDDDVPVGRISAHVNHQYEKYRDNKTGFFGFFESIEDQKVADLLFDAAGNWLQQQGKSRILGPMSFGMYDISGLLIEGFTPPVVMTAYNPPYYQRLLEQAGFKKAIDWYAFLVSKENEINPVLRKVRDRVKRQKKILIRPINLKKLDEEVNHIQKIFTDAWMENWQHVPFTEEELHHLKSELKQIVVKQVTELAFYEGDCIGFSLSIKDANQALKAANGRLFPFGLLKILWHMRKINRMRTIAMGVLKEHRHRGIDIAFYIDTIEKGTNLGYMDSECSIIVESNERMIKALEDLSARKHKTFRFFEKNI
jgi:hypothetical protein